MRGERAVDRRSGVLDRVMIVSVALARSRSRSGSSVSPGPRCRGGEGVRAAAQNPRVYVIVLGIDPGVANTGYGVVAQQRGRLVALDGGVIETAAGRAAGAPARRHPRRASAS